MATRGHTITLYRAILRAGRKYPDYNIREFIARRAREDFRANAALSGPAAAAALASGAEQLAVVTRTATVAGLYAGGPSVMETGGAGAGRAGKAAAAAGAAGPVPVLGFPKTVIDDV